MGRPSGPERTARWRSAALGEARQCVQLVAKDRRGVRGIDTCQERQRHDDDAAAAGTGHGSDVGASLSARGDLAQVVHGARVAAYDDSQVECPTVLDRSPGRAIISDDRVGESRRPLGYAVRLGEQTHDCVGIGFALDALGLGASVHATTLCAACGAGWVMPGDRSACGVSDRFWSFAASGMEAVLGDGRAGEDEQSTDKFVPRDGSFKKTAPTMMANSGIR
jgi:hypothetical protein